MLSYKRIFHSKYLFDFLKEDISHQISPISPKKKTLKRFIHSVWEHRKHPFIHLFIHPFSPFIHVLAARAEKARRCCCGRRGLLRPSCCCRDCGGRRSSSILRGRSCAKHARESRDRCKLLLSKMGYKKSLQWSSTPHFFLRLRLRLRL